MQTLAPPPFRPKQVYEQVAGRIRAEIRNGRFAPGSRLPSERDLAGLYGVGRPAVREAIGALQNEGLVVTRRNSGTYVSEQMPEPGFSSEIPDADHADNDEPAADLSPIATLETRLVLEPAIARRAAQNRTNDRLAEHYLSQMDSVADITDPAQAALWSHSDRMFHRQIAVMTGNALWVTIAEEVAKSMDQPLWQRLRDDGIHDPARIALYVAEHRLIYEAIVNGDGDAAAFYVEQHIHRVRRDIAPK
jgi:DNA-binding FadR family transcriptional regulator